MEMATLFFCRSADLYLDEDGIIAFLMPISVITATLQHFRFKKFEYPHQELLEILNFEKIRDIFSLPVCVIIAKKGGFTKYPVDMQYYYGKIDRYKRNAKLVELDTITTKTEKYNLPPTIQFGTYSYYYDKFKAGATLNPRNFWFVSFEMHKTLGINLDRPLVKTSQEVMEVGKPEWNDIILEDNVEADYIYAALWARFDPVRTNQVQIDCFASYSQE